MPSFHNQVSLDLFTFEDSHLTFNISGSVTQGSVGLAVSLDAAAANTMKLAADGDVVVGQLLTLENRIQTAQQIGTVALRFACRFPIKTGDTVAVGDTVVGGGAGTVKKAPANNPNTNWVAEIVTEGATAFAIVLKI